MSRAFVKNDAADEPVIVARRAPLPPGATNYVTPRGMTLLRKELAGLESERTGIESGFAADDPERTRQLVALAQRMKDLLERIESARIVPPHTGAPEQVCFGATVVVRTVTGANPGEERTLTIVGVDEAEAAAGLVSYLSPIAKAMIGSGVGDTVSLRTAKGEDTLEIVAITAG